MPVLNLEQKTVSFKIVYCGTPLSGKTANLQQIHAKLDPEGRSDLVSLSTARDRTLFFDFLSVESAALPGHKTAFHLYTVPGQVTYNATLQLVLRQADGIVFVADSQMDRQRDNIQAFQALDANLRLNGSSLDRLPLVLQYNKRDLPNAAPVEYLEFLLNNRPSPGSASRPRPAPAGTSWPLSMPSPRACSPAFIKARVPGPLGSMPMPDAR